IFITPSERADFGMRIFNADGSEAEMCGNGIRCVGKYVYDKGYTDKKHLRIETLAGIKTLELQTAGCQVRSVRVKMGTAAVSEERCLDLNGLPVRCMPVNVGNPHAVVFTDQLETDRVETLGKQIEHLPVFPEGVNVEFVQILNETELRMRVWERGSGITAACGTGACASVAAAVRKGFCQPDKWITVQLDGGPLQILIDFDGNAEMIGPAETVYEGETSLC
ncbi:MAG: diaminopimelate epimerase, partial [Clostridia bacterium]|nr:diaminopimelate epimerase [Clostridia bacterium]